MPKAVRDIVTGKTFDNGVLCSSPNSVVVDGPVVEEVKREFVKNGGYFMSPAEMDAVAKVLRRPQRLPNPALVGRPATYIAQQAGITVPADTRVLIAELKGVGRDYPAVDREALPRALLLCRRPTGGKAASAATRSCATAAWVTPCRSTRGTIRSFCEFGLKKPAYRIVVNTPTTHGSIGLTTGLDPAMTLGCGGWGGNITSDNISPRHLLNIKRLAYEINAGRRCGNLEVSPADSTRAPLPRPPAAPPVPRRQSPQTCSPGESTSFLTSRGYRGRRPQPAPVAHPSRLGAERARAGRTERERRKAGRLRMRRRRPAGTPSGTQNCNRGALDRYTGRPRPRGTASAFRPSELA